MQLVRQLTLFGIVGVAATLIHVGVASVLLVSTTIDPYVSNVVGAGCAMTVSFFGNARLTFLYEGRVTAAILRFLAQTGLSLALTTLILYFVEENAYPVWTYALLVTAIVPPISFLVAKSWVFRA